MTCPGEVYLFKNDIKIFVAYFSTKECEDALKQMLMLKVTTHLRPTGLQMFSILTRLLTDDKKDI